jgi:hypothetical protein
MEDPYFEVIERTEKRPVTLVKIPDGFLDERGKGNGRFAEKICWVDTHTRVAIIDFHRNSPFPSAIGPVSDLTLLIKLEGEKRLMKSPSGAHGGQAQDSIRLWWKRVCCRPAG